MPSAARMLHRAAVAASRNVKKTLAYSSFPTVPTGTVDVAITAGAGPVGVNGATLQEGSRTSGSGGFNSVAVLPDEMGTDLFSVTITVGSLSAAATNRAVGPGAFNAAGTKGVIVRFSSSSSTASISSWDGSTETTEATLGSQSAGPGDQITLTPSVSGDLVTWTVAKNGTPTALIWTDSSHVIDLPGKHPAACFRHNYSGGDFPSRGVAALTASDL